MFKFLLNLFLIFLIGSFQIGLLPFLGFLGHLNLLLCLCLYLGLKNYSKGLWWSLGGGFILDLSSSLPFGTYTLVLLITFLLINFLYKKFFTLPSLSALVFIALGGTLFYQILLFSLSWLFYLVKLTSQTFLSINMTYLNALIWQIALNLIFLFTLDLIVRKCKI
jgi:rod shape-determining protein MreD